MTVDAGGNRFQMDFCMKSGSVGFYFYERFRATPAPQQQVMDVRLGEDGRRQVMVYTFNPEFLSWAEHESRAAAWGGHIASISSREQNSFILRMQQEAGTPSGQWGGILWIG